MRCLDCGVVHMHIIGPCPSCFTTQDGLLMGTVTSNYKGRVTAECIDCNKTFDFYVDAQERNIWKMELIETGRA